MSSFEGEGSIAIKLELTARRGKSYHGSMAEQSVKEVTPYVIEKVVTGTPESNRASKDNFSKPRPVVDNGKKVEVKQATEESKEDEQREREVVRKAAEEKRANELLQEVKRGQDIMAQRRFDIRGQYEATENKGGKESSGILKTIFQAIFEILKALFSDEDGNQLEKRMMNSPAVKAVLAYSAFKPQNNWNGEDYARVLCIIGADDSLEGKTIKRHLTDEAKSRNLGGEVFDKRVDKIDSKYKFLSGFELSNSGEAEKKREAVRRAGAMHYELWSDMKASGGLKDLNGEKLRSMYNFWDEYKGNMDALGAGGIDPDMILGSIVNETNRRVKAESSSGTAGRLRGGSTGRMVNDPTISEIRGKTMDGRVRFSGEPGRRSSGLTGKVDNDNSITGSGGGEPPGRGRLSSGSSGTGSGFTRTVDDDQSIIGGGSGEPPGGRPPGAGTSGDGGGNGEVTQLLGGIKKATERGATASEKSSETLARIEAVLEDISNKVGKIYKQQRDSKDQGDRREREEKLAKEDQRIRDAEQQKLREADYILEQKKRKAEQERERGQTPEEELIRKTPWKETDNELYDGNIDDTQGERMMRIVYLSMLSRRNGNTDGLDAEIYNSKSVINPNVEDISPRDQKRRKDFLIRMKKDGSKIFTDLKNKEAIYNEQAKYMRELKRWVRTIIKNSQYEGGNLTISEKAYEEFQKVLATKARIFEYGDINDSYFERVGKFQDGFAKAVDILNEQGFLEFFRRREKDERGNPTGEIKQFGYKEGKVSYFREGGVPNSIWETCALIQQVYSNEGYGTGEEHELIDDNGEFVLKNLLHFFKERMYENSDRNSQSEINTLQQATLRTTYADIPIGMLMDVPRYTQSRDFMMKGDATDVKNLKSNGGLENAGWGEYKEMEEFSYDRREDYKKMIWNFDFRHNDGVRLAVPNTVKLSRDKWAETFNAHIEKGDWYRRGYTYLWHQMPSSRGNEVKDYFEKYKQGSLGKANRDSILFYIYMTNFTDFYMKRNKDNGKIEGVRGVDENLAYKALGVDGSSAYLLSIAEHALMYAEKDEVDQKNQFKVEYKKYVKNFIQDNELNYKADPEKAKIHANLVKKYINMLEETPDSKMIIGFDTAKIFKKNNQPYDLLFDYQKDVETMINGKGLVNDDEAEKWVGSASMIVTRGAIKNTVKKQMRRKIKEGYFDKIKGVTVERAGIALGEIEVDVDLTKGGKGRIIDSKKDLPEMIANKRDTGKIKIADILDEFANFHELDELSFEEAWTKKKEKYKNMSVKERDSRMKAELKDYYDNIERNERLGLALITKVANIERRKLNWFSQTQSPDRVKDIMKRSLKASMGKVYQLEAVEADIVDEASFYSTEPLLIAAKNNTTYNEKVNQGTWYTDFGKVLAAKRGEHPNRQGLFGHIKALCPGSVWEFIEVSEPGRPLPGEAGAKTLLEDFQGGAGADMLERCERDNSGRRYEKDTSQKSMQSVWNRAFIGGGRIISVLTNEEEMDFDDIMKPDPYFPGRYVFDSQKARAKSDKWWEPIKDFCDRAEIDDWKRKIVYEGRETTVEELMFSDKIIQARETMKSYYGTRAKWASSKAERDEYLKMMKEIDEKPGIAVFTFMAASSIHEHSKLFSGIYEKWDLDEVNRYVAFLEEFFARGKEDTVNGQRKYKNINVSRIPLNIINEVMMKTKKKSITDMAFVDLLWAMCAGIFQGVFVETPKELGEAYLKSVQPIRAVS